MTHKPQALIRGNGFSTNPADTITDVDEETNGGVNLFTRPNRTPVTISRPLGNGYENSSSSGRPSKNYSGTGGGVHKDRGVPLIRQYSSLQDDSSFPSDEKEDPLFLPAKTEKQQYARAEQRTIIAKNLSDRATHKDIVDIIRGGAVLDIFLRTNERSASISFVEGSAAQDFLSYTKRNDIYIHGKRVNMHLAKNFGRLMSRSLNSPGMIDSLFFLATLRIRLGLAQPGTW